MIGISRRTWLKSTASGFGYLAFSALAAGQEDRAANPLAPKKPHFEPRAKRVIFLCMDGGPAHMDTFDYKPRLTADDGKPAPRGRFAGAKLLGSPWKFRKHGQSGQYISELFPSLSERADDLCIIKSMQTDLPNHPQAFVQMHAGIFQFPRPSLGSWALYGLGSENENLPGFVTINPPANNGGSANYGSSFLPPVYQGTRIGQAGRPVANSTVSNLEHPKQTTSTQRLQLDYLQSLNRASESQEGVDGLMASYELAFRMQGELPKLMRIDNESEATRQLYGIGSQETDDFGRQCLLARKFVEAGVRFVELCHPGWDQHRNLRDAMTRNCKAIDKPIAGLLTDLASRGLLQDTLVIWAGEFGRTATAQNGDGRDHNNKGYSIWMAGGGVKGGLSYGQTDDYGTEAVENKVHIHDWHATILHLLGLNHEMLTFRHAGREMRLTDTKGLIVKGILA